MPHLTEHQAFDAMREFLTRHYRRTGASEIGGLLGDLEPQADGNPADQGLYEDWQQCVASARSQRPHRDAAE